MWSSGMAMAASICGATSCIVFVHRTRKSAAGLEGSPSPCEQLARFVPSFGMLEPLDLGEVDAVEEDPGRVQTAQALSDDPFDRLVVRDRRLPAHSSQEADRLHRVSALSPVTL